MFPSTSRRGKSVQDGCMPDRSDESPRALGDYARRLATGAAEVVRNADSRAAHSIEAKTTSTDLVTAVDKRSERWLVDQIARDRPDDGVLGEEGGERGGSSGVRWVLDPIDGTVNFVLGLPQYAVSVAAEVDGHVVAGAVCNPATGEMFHAVRGGGAWLDGQRLSGPRNIELVRAVIGTGFSYDRGRRGRQAAVVAELLPLVADIRRLGSAALDLCAVAAGRLDAYFEVGLNLWDYAAGALVATEAGCTVSGLHGAAASTRITVAVGAELAPDLIATLTRLNAEAVW
jgi:myo-inositol-1(or 4)-monophosphatase